MADLLPIMGAGSYSYLENTSNELELLKEYAYDIEKDDYILDSSGNFEIVYGLDALIIRNYLTMVLRMVILIVKLLCLYSRNQSNHKRQLMKCIL